MRVLVPALGVLAIVATEATAQGRGRRGGDLGQVWKFLAEKYDKNEDGKITADEYDRGADKFARYDRNGDGVLTEADWQGGGRNRGGRGPNPAMVLGMIIRSADGDRDGVITSAEWKARAGDAERVEDLIPERMQRRAERMVPVLTQALDTDKDGTVSAREIAAAFGTLDKNGDGKVTRDELGMRNRARRGDRGAEKIPQRGESAPDFDLPLVKDPKKAVKLSSFAGKRPVALIFGSYT